MDTGKLVSMPKISFKTWKPALYTVMIVDFGQFIFFHLLSFFDIFPRSCPWWSQCCPLAGEQRSKWCWSRERGWGAAGLVIIHLIFMANPSSEHWVPSPLLLPSQWRWNSYSGDWGCCCSSDSCSCLQVKYWTATSCWKSLKSKLHPLPPDHPATPLELPY